MMQKQQVLQLAVALSVATSGGIMLAQLGGSSPFPETYQQMQINSDGSFVKIDHTECSRKSDFDPCQVEDNCKKHYCYQGACSEGESKCDDGDPITVDSCDYSWPYPYQCKHVDDSGMCRTNDDCQELSQPVPGGSDECAPFGFCDPETHRCRKQSRDGDPCSPESNASVNMQERPDSCFTVWACQYGRCHGEGLTDQCRCGSDERTGPDCSCKNGKQPPLCTECPDGLTGDNCSECKNGDLNPPACDDCMGDEDPGDDDSDGVCNSKDPCPKDADAVPDSWGRCPSKEQPQWEPARDGEEDPLKGTDDYDPLAVPEEPWFPGESLEPLGVDSNPFEPDIESLADNTSDTTDDLVLDVPVPETFPTAPSQEPVFAGESEDTIVGGGGNDVIADPVPADAPVEAPMPDLPSLPPLPAVAPPEPTERVAVEPPTSLVPEAPPAPEAPVQLQFRDAAQVPMAAPSPEPPAPQMPAPEPDTTADDASDAQAEPPAASSEEPDVPVVDEPGMRPMPDTPVPVPVYDASEPTVVASACASRPCGIRNVCIDLGADRYDCLPSREVERFQPDAGYVEASKFTNRAADLAKKSASHIEPQYSACVYENSAVWPYVAFVCPEPSAFIPFLRVLGSLLSSF